MKMKLLFFVFGVLGFLSGSANGQETQVPKSLTDGWTRVYFFSGYHVGLGWRPNLSSANFFINESQVASLTEGQYAVIDIKSGTYFIGCSPTDASKNFPVARSITFKSGGYKYFACDMDNFTEETRAKDGALAAAFAVPFGFLGGAVGGAIGGAIVGASDASLSDFKTKSFLDERPLPPSYMLTSYTKSSELNPKNTVQSVESKAQGKATGAGGGDAIGKLKELKEMKDQGLITETEYRNKKKAVIDQM